MISSRITMLQKLSAEIDTYSPLIIYGNAGMGKSYFARELCERLCQTGRIENYRIYPTWEFINTMIEALSNQGRASWRDNFIAYDLIVIDDYQYFSGKSASAEELYHILSAMEVPVIITTSAPIWEVDVACDELTAYLSAGAVVNLNDTCSADSAEYLHHFLQDNAIRLTTETVDWLLRQHIPSLAVVKGIVRTLELYQEKTDLPMDIAECQRILAPLFS